MAATDLAVIDNLLTDAASFRAALSAMQGGVVGGNDFRVVPRAAGSNRSVDVGPAGAVSRAVLTSPVAAMPGALGPNYMVGAVGTQNSDAFELGGITAPHATFARLDQIIARLYDNEAGQKKWRLEVLTGAVPAGVNTLDSAPSRAALPAGVPVLRIADVLVPTTGIITATEIRDRRPYARGYNYEAERSSTDINFPTGGAGFAVIDNNNFQRRAECSGAPVEIDFEAQALQAAAVTGVLHIRLLMDNVAMKLIRETMPASANTYRNLVMKHRVIPAAGSHVFTMSFSQDSGMSAQILSSSIIFSTTFGIEEKIAGNVDNGSS